MLGKLFKHDMRQISKVMFPFMILIFGTTILGTVALKFAREISYSFGDNLIRNALNSSLYIIFGFSAFALFAYAVLAVFLSVSRYYKNFFSDEGYLTFTLPVKSSALIFSKLLATLIWIFISAVVVTVCILIYVTFGGAPIGKAINVDFWITMKDGMWFILKDIFSGINVSEAFLLIELFALGFIATVYGVLSLFLAVTIGSIVAKKHKILASIGFYYLINTAISTVTMVFTTVISFVTARIYDIYSSYSSDALVHTYLIGILLMYAVIIVVEFLITNYLLSNKLNLQ